MPAGRVFECLHEKARVIKHKPEQGRLGNEQLHRFLLCPGTFFLRGATNEQRFVASTPRAF